LKEKEQESRIVNSRLNTFSRNTKSTSNTVNGRVPSPKAMIEINDEGASHLPKIRTERDINALTNMKG
jgi:hypothetical protein